MPRASIRSSLPRGQAAINTFARATKPGIAPSKSVLDGKSKQPDSDLSVSPSKKRKLNELENVDCGSPCGGKETTTSQAGTLTPSKSLRLSKLSVSTPRSGHYASPTRNDWGALTDEKSATPTSPSKRSVARDSNPQHCRVLEVRSACVEELLNLHMAFVKALTLHAAHHGIVAPAELHEFLHSIERLWKKRKVVAKDLQRLIWIWEQVAQSTTSAPRFRLANYGLGRVCLERMDRTQQVNPVNENELHDQFEQTVELLWEKALDAVGGDENRVDFIATLGVSSIHESLTPFTTFRKGQQRLQDLKGGVIKLKTERLRSTNTQEAEGQVKTPEATNARRMGLLDRIRDKALRQSKLPPPPSKEMILRGAAAQRAEEVAGVLACLRPAGYVGSGPKATVAAQRKPFRLEMIVQNVQDSMRNPISDREVEICLEILSQTDIAGQWVNLVTVNQIKSVVLKSCADVNLKDIGTKVSQLNLEPKENLTL
ncbi:DNA replication factor Cdt1 C-terminal domain-containing protein [Aspergillus tanneri]|nr:uncharacterized protein ATNIH1004_007512 [Aspergillus tanneri]KAA8646089.1 hypothetical protein ATNIH1004_007512 [Aspergillus tanneri]